MMPTISAVLVAWNSVSFQSARILGLYLLGLDLRRLGVGFIELAIYALFTVIVMGRLLSYLVFNV